MANFSSCTIGCLPGDVSLVRATFFLDLVVDCRNSIIFINFSVQCLPSDFPGSIHCGLQGENRSVCVLSEMLLGYCYANLKYQKGCLYESGPRKKVGLDEGHLLVSFVLVIRQASHHKAF